MQDQLARNGTALFVPISWALATKTLAPARDAVTGPVNSLKL